MIGHKHATGLALLTRVLSAGMLAIAVTTGACASEPTTEDIAKMRAAMPDKAAVAPAQERKLLVFDRCNGYRHDSIEYWNAALQIMGEKTGAFTVVVSDDMAVFEPESLQQFDAVCFNNTTRLTFSDEELRVSLLDFLRGGKGVVGIHAATDNFYDWPEMAMIMGGQFQGHPWGAGGTWAIKIDEPDHTLTQPFEGQGFKLSDEIYRTNAPYYSRARQRVLMSLDMTDEATREQTGVKPEDHDTGISWVKTVGQGRVFYCALGHNRPLTWDRKILDHYMLGIQFALGDLAVETTPSLPNASMFEDMLAPVATYEYADSRAPLTKIEGVVVELMAEPTLRNAMAEAMADMLGGDITYAGKDFLCRQLSLIGTETQVPVLARMLPDEKESHLARYALERITGPTAQAALLDALGKTSGPVQVGIINSLGQRREAGPEEQLAALVREGYVEAAVAAATSLGYIGTPAAVEQLQQARRQIPSQENKAVAAAVAEGLLTCAESLHKAGATSQAREVYASLYESPQSPLIQLGALRGLATTAQSAQRRDEWILSALDAQKAIVQAGAIAMVGDLETAAAVEQAAGRMQSMSNQNKVRMLSALTQQRGDRVTPAVMQAIVRTSSDNDEAVRIAALEALGVLGGKGQVEMLARRAAETQGAEAGAARDALAQIDGDAASDEVLRLLATLQGQAKVELVTAIGARNMTGAVDRLLEAARAENAAVRKEAYKVLRQMAGPEHVAALVELVVSPEDPADRGQAENTTVTAAQKAASPEEAAVPVVAAWQQAQDPDVRAALLRVLADLPTNASLGALRQGLQDTSTTVREAALRGLAAWPTAEPMQDLATVAEQATDNKNRILAFRGFVRMIPLSGTSASQQLALYRRAAALAPNANERKGVLAGLATIESVEALEMAAEYLDEPALQEEAAVAVISIAEHTAKDAPEATRKALRRAVDLVRNEQAKQTGQKILDQLG